MGILIAVAIIGGGIILAPIARKEYTKYYFKKHNLKRVDDNLEVIKPREYNRKKK